MKKLIILAVAVSALISCISVKADVLKTAMGEKKGHFSAYKNSKFIMKSEKGKKIEIPKATARELILESPVNVTFKRKGKSKSESAELLGYSKLQFQLKQKNKKVSLSAMYVTSMEAHVPMSAGPGGTVRGGDTSIRAIDTSKFDESTMTASQKSALASYRAVRKRYDAFLSQSAAMVAEMDRSTGQQREKLLSKLRIRKNQEQPIRNEMSAAHKSFLAAFPNGFPLKSAKAPVSRRGPVMPPPGKSAEEVIEKSADIADGEVLLIDVSGLGSSGDLTDHQMEAIDTYDKAAIAYQQISAKQAALARAVNAAADADKVHLMPVFEQGEKDATAAKKAVLKAQKAFLKAFPTLQLTE